MLRLQDKIAIVTGGGKGIGLACSRLMAREGCNVVLTQRHEEEGRQAVENIRNEGGEALFAAQDVTVEQDWVDVLDKTREAFGDPDVLVNNAGIYIIEDLDDTDVEQWRKLMGVNGMGVMLGMKHCAPVMAGKGGGSIVNMSSVAGLAGVPRHALYSASKGAVLSMTQDAAIEYARQKVRVNSVHPGYIDTRMADYGAEEQDTSKSEGLAAMHPMGRIGEPDEVGWAVVYLASDESSFVTGARLVIDGGFVAS